MEWNMMFSDVLMEYHLAFQKKGIPPFATTWTELDCFMLSEIRQIEKDKYCIVSFTCETLKKVKLLETESRKVVARVWLGGIGRG